MSIVLGLELWEGFCSPFCCFTIVALFNLSNLNGCHDAMPIKKWKFGPYFRVLIWGCYNQGTTGRPARAHDAFQKISSRTRLSKPGEPREGFLFARDLPSRGHLRCSARIKPKGSARPPASSRFIPASRGSFPSKQALSSRQSAHGLCALRRVTGAPELHDDSAAVAILVYKADRKSVV